MSVAIRDGALEVDGVKVSLIAGAVHYWRLERSRWPAILRRVRDMGLRIVQSYVPWSVHELAQGRFDFGTYDPMKDLAAFLDLCAREGLYVLARPGPHINAELTYFGYPKRVLTMPDVQARSATGSPVILPHPPRAFPVPSYASERFYEEVGIYFDAACEILSKYVHPKGPIIGVQADNEMSMFFRTGAYDHDYSDAARELYHGFLKAKYGEVAELNAAYRSSYGGFEQVPMPVSFEARSAEDLPRYLDWMAYKEHYIAGSLARISGMLRERGMDGILHTHNWPPSLPESPMNIAAVERELDVQGLDLYPQRTDAPLIRRRVLHYSGMSRLPFSPEFSSGCYLTWPPIGLEDQRFTTLYALMHGLRAMTFYMIVERDRWYGSPVTRDGRTRPDYFSFFRNLLEALDRSSLPLMHKRRDAILLVNRDYDRLEKASSLLGAVPAVFMEEGPGHWTLCSEERLGFDRCIQIEHRRHLDRLYDLLCELGHAFDMGDTDIAPERLSEYRAALVPTFEFMSAESQSRLVEFAEAGGTLIVGPEIPDRDAFMEAGEVLGRRMRRPTDKICGEPECVEFACGEGRIVLLTDTAPAPGKPEEKVWLSVLKEVLERAGVRRFYAASIPGIETALHENPGGKGGRVLFAANPSDRAAEARIPLESPGRFRDLLTGEEFNCPETLVLPLEAYTVRMLEVLR